jgi:signal transduction histidine kinase
LLPQNEPFIAPAPRDNFQFGFLVPEREMTPPQHFKTRFQSSMILIGLAALLGAVGIGFLIARIVSRPLNKLGTGMKKLRQSHYKFQLEENDSEEFNALIKEFNSLASELNRVEELRKNLISDTSHELRTPLSSLMAQLEGMEDGVIALDKERIKLLREQVDRLSELTEELQDYASLRSQSIKPQLKNFHLKEIINKITEQFKISLAEKKMAVHLNFADDYRLTADEKLIERAFTNLFDNAIRYSKAENININANQEQIIFTDDGVGIPEAHLSDIFERFFRLEKSRSRQTGGLGLGLSIVREIIEAHGWKIKARIPENKKGVEFVIELVNK